MLFRSPGTPGVLLYVTARPRPVPRPGGLGLGLAVVQRSVHEMGGVVWVGGAREGGAAFKVFLPAAEGERPA